MRRTSFALTLLLGALLSACGALTGPAPTPEPWTPPPTTAPTEPTAAPVEPTTVAIDTFTVQRGTVEQRLTLQGEIIEARERELIFSFDGTVETIAVAEGDTFAKGDLLAQLAMGELTDQLAQAQSILTQEQEALARSTADKQLPVRRAEIELESARTALALLSEPPTAAEFAQARADVQQAEANLARVRNDSSAAKNRAEQQLRQAQRQLVYAQTDFSAAYDLVQRSDSDERAAAEQRLAEANDALRAAEDAVANAQIDFDTARGNEIAAIQGAEALLEVARANLAKLESGPDASDVAAARRNVEIAELALAEARQRVVPDPELASRVDAAELTVDRIFEQMEARRIYAPFDGQVLAVNVSTNTPVRAGDVVLSVIDAAVDASALEVRARNADETVADSLRIGLPVELSFARFPGQTIAGTIVQAPITSNLGIVNPTVRVRFDSAALALTNGDIATATILVARKDNALWLPVEAVGFDARYYVMAPDGEAANRVNIEVGIVGVDRIEILSGLREGDIVVGVQ
jgi:multidrug efflux pump subunit AcrA (membrane-fusion protein)